jgi:DNA-binding transcriptional ArsR family regulator
MGVKNALVYGRCVMEAGEGFLKVRNPRTIRTETDDQGDITRVVQETDDGDNELPADNVHLFLLHRHFLAEDEELWEDENTRILFGRRQKRAVGLLLADKPGASTREIAEALMLSPDTVRYHLRTLMAHELVERYPSGQTNLYEPAEALVQWAREVGDGFDRPWEE